MPLNFYNLQYAQYCANIGAIAIYPLQEPSGTSINDYSGNGYNGELSGTGTTQGNLLYPTDHYKFYNFNGNSYINLGSANQYLGGPVGGADVSKQSGFITAWIKASLPNAGGGMIAYWNNFGLSVNNIGNISIFQPNENYNPNYNFSFQIPITTTLMDGNEHFICAYINKIGDFTLQDVYTEDAYIFADIWIDGILVINGYDCGLVPMNISSPTDFGTQFYNMYADTSSIAAYKDGTKNFTGNLSNVVFFPYNLTQAQINQLYVLGTSKISPTTQAQINQLYVLGTSKISPTNEIDYVDNFYLIDSNKTYLQADQPSNAPELNINLKKLHSEFVYSLRLDYLTILEKNGICPTPPAPIILPINYSAPPASNGVSAGNYYRVPKSTATLNNLPLPKYFDSFSFPIGTFVYPTSSEYNGLMLVKSSNLNISLPFDVIQLTHTQALTDLSTYINEIFAF